MNVVAEERVRLLKECGFTPVKLGDDPGSFYVTIEEKNVDYIYKVLKNTEDPPVRVSRVASQINGGYTVVEWSMETESAVGTVGANFTAHIGGGGVAEFSEPMQIREIAATFGGFSSSLFNALHENPNMEINELRWYPMDIGEEN